MHCCTIVSYGTRDDDVGPLWRRRFGASLPLRLYVDVMIRKAFRMAVLSGHESAYEQRHSPIWRELADGITAHGAHRYSIFLDESDGSLFGYVEVEDEARWAAIAATPVCRRWWTHMSGSCR